MTISALISLLHPANAFGHPSEVRRQSGTDMNDRTDDNFSLDQLLHPANAFGHPSEVTRQSGLCNSVDVGQQRFYG